MSGTAAFVRKLDGFNGDARLYKVSEPVEYGWKPDDEPKDTTEWLVVSAANVMFSGPETYIFPGNAQGEVVDWGELDGSFRGGLDHEEALAGAGYTVTS